MNTPHLTQRSTRQSHGIVVFAVLSGLLGLLINWCGNLYSYSALEPAPVRLHGVRITYYHPLSSENTSGNSLDPYNCFLKDAKGDFMIRTTGKDFFSNACHSTFRGYELRTKMNNPVLVYQETPALNWRYKSNCFGLTFLNGEYWLLGDQVEQILLDNDWKIVRESEAQARDVAIYRLANGSIVHAARVMGRDDDGHILVNSKNGWSIELIQVRATDIDILTHGT